ncbi:MAG: hypothetical protein HC831_00490 [Chloroflexia bacterium]|nr:hypothetical protein [Chloroflexia bacterium]
MFGNIFDHLTESTQTLFACNLTRNINEYRNVIIHLPPNIELDGSFSAIIQKLARLPFSIATSIEMRSDNTEQINKYKSLFTKRNKVKFILNKYDKLTDYESASKPNCLDIYFLLRKESVAYKTVNNQFASNRISDDMEKDFIVVVPGLG